MKALSRKYILHKTCYLLLFDKIMICTCTTSHIQEQIIKTNFRLYETNTMNNKSDYIISKLLCIFFQINILDKN